MKKTSLITLGVIMSTLILCCCDEQKRCVDPDGVVVEDEKCREEEKARSSGRSAGSSFRWYYGGQGYGMGSRVTGGSHTVSRGGFGSLAAFHSSGGG